MQHQKRGLQATQRVGQLRLADVLDKVAADGEVAPRQADRRRAGLGDGVERGAEVAQHMRRVGGRVQRHHRAHALDARRRREHRRAAQRMADQQLRGEVVFGHPGGRGPQVGDVRREIGIGEFAPGMAQPGKVEAQRGDAARGQRTGDAARGGDVLGTGEAMREKRRGAHRPLRPVEPGGQGRAAGSGEFDPLAAHHGTSIGSGPSKPAPGRHVHPAGSAGTAT
jgi:hypothetical protein